MWSLWISVALGADPACVFDADAVWKEVVRTVKRSPDAHDVRLGDHRLDLRTADGAFVVLAVRGCNHLEIQATIVVPDPWSELPAGSGFAHAADAARLAPGHLDADLLQSWVAAPPAPTVTDGRTVTVGGDETWPHVVTIVQTPAATVVHVVRSYD